MKFIKNYLFIILIVILFLFLSLNSKSSLNEMQDPNEFSQSPPGFRCDGGYCRDGQEHILDCSGTGGICTGDFWPGNFPTIINPHFGSGDWLNDGDTVLGITLGNESKAYPLRILSWYETLDDTIANKPILVSYCPLCGSGIIYSRLIDLNSSLTELTFLNTGEIWKSDLVMYDNETMSRWTQIGGIALTDPLNGSRLTLLLTQQVKWKDWKISHPKTLVLDQPKDDQGIPVLSFNREFYTPKTIVTGVTINGEAIAFPLNILEQEKLVILSFEGENLIVGFVSNAVHIFKSNGNNFEYLEDGTIQDTDTGIVYDLITGQSLTTDDQLEKLESQSMYRFAWDNFYPISFIYDGTGTIMEQDPQSVTFWNENNFIFIFSIFGATGIALVIIIWKKS